MENLSNEYQFSMDCWSDEGLKVEQYISLYKIPTSVILKIKKYEDLKFFLFIAQEVQYNTNIILIDAIFRQRAANSLKLDKYRISKSLKRLISLGFIAKGETIYRVNPYIVFRGQRCQRNKIISSMERNLISKMY